MKGLSKPAKNFNGMLISSYSGYKKTDYVGQEQNIAKHTA